MFSPKAFPFVREHQTNDFLTVLCPISLALGQTRVANNLHLAYRGGIRTFVLKRWAGKKKPSEEECFKELQLVFRVFSPYEWPFFPFLFPWLLKFSFLTPFHEWIPKCIDFSWCSTSKLVFRCSFGPTDSTQYRSQLEPSRHDWNSLLLVLSVASEVFRKSLETQFLLIFFCKKHKCISEAFWEASDHLPDMGEGP